MALSRAKTFVRPKTTPALQANQILILVGQKTKMAHELSCSRESQKINIEACCIAVGQNIFFMSAFCKS